MNREVVVTGAGLVTAHGAGCDAFWDGLVAGTTPEAAPGAEGAGPLVPPDVAPGRRDAMSWLRLAVAEALGPSGADGTGAVVLGAQARARPGTTHPLRAPEIVAVGRTGLEPVVVSHACASGLFAIELGRRLVASGVHDRVLVGAATSLNAPATESLRVVRALGGHPSRPFDVRRDGIRLGEGAGAVLLESSASAAARGAAVLARVAGSAARIGGTSSAASDAPTILGVMTDALRAAGATEVGHVHAHATGTVQGDGAELEALSLLARATDSAVTATSHKGALGHLLHASAFPGLVAALRSLATGIVPGSPGLARPEPAVGVFLPTAGTTTTPAGGVPSVLVNAFGFGGNNASVLLERA